MAEGYRHRLVGQKNPNYRDALNRHKCVECGQTIKSYNKTRKYCSQACSNASVERREAMRRHTRRDLNHEVIANAYRQLGCGVFDLATQGYGVPDLMVWCQGIWHGVEVKNPKTAYGRRGLTAPQQRMNALFDGSIEVVMSVEQAVEMVLTWRNGPSSTKPMVDVVSTPEEAVALFEGKKGA